jgi:NAD(P)-dependent dehydrogenase (short-subunit alcohol dehydrogenase family)
MNHFDLTGRVALVTGGSRGLGRVTSEALAEAGADVMIASRDAANCKRVAGEIADSTGRRTLGYGCHVGKWEQLDGLVEAAYEHFGQVDILVNNAGMSPLYESLDSVSQALWQKIIDVNLSGPFRLAALVGARMMAGDGGSIINVSSVASQEPMPATVPYAAAKAGLNAMTIGCARAFGPKVRVNAVVPGTFFTDVSRAWDMAAFEREASGFALRRGGRPDEIVGAMLYLASEASSYTTGALLNVDGGYVPPTSR